MKFVNTVIFLFCSLALYAQRPILPAQNQLYKFIEDPSFLSLNNEYNMTALIQSSNSNITETSQYLVAQLGIFDNIVFGLDYAKHSFESQRYSNLSLSTRVRFNFDDFYHYFNIGLSLGTDKIFERESSRENDISTTYRVAGHYKNYNLTIGGFLNHYPFKNPSILNTVNTLTRDTGYAVYGSYDIAISDNFRLTPLLRYNSFSNLNFFEGVARADYKGKLDLALSYRDTYSINAAIGMKFFDRMKVSYAYEKAIGAQNFIDIHAIGISIDLAAEATNIPEWYANVKKNRVKLRKRKSKKSKLITDDLPEVEIAKTLNDSTVTEIASEDILYPKMSEADPNDIINNKLKPGYYIILGSFKNIDNAKSVVEKLKSEGSYARIGKKSADDDFNYIYVDRYTDKAIASKRTIAKQKEKGFERVWLLKIE